MRLALFTLLFSLAGHVSGQHPLCMGEVHALHSAILAEERILNIVLPPGYAANDTARYPVIFLLDGSADEDFMHVAGALQFATMDWIAWQQPSILVGIANTDRKRDLTFPTSIAKDKEQFPTTGGSADFRRFLGQELIPFVDDHFRTRPDRLLIGQSLGGLLAAEVLLVQPALFQRYLIVSPSLWWDNGSLLERSAGSLWKPGTAPAQVFIAVGREGREMVRYAKQLHALVARSKATRTKFQYLHDFNHANILHQAVMDGFRWMGTSP
ncbi:MAG: alpha/beta hydrolase [Flavobacteriales bacterium]|nr:alpha/beta hydrolase [Flavobacteriales bacterium]MBP9079093.1 alpha/beta hydrolase [Flavobacteriales bacterium]